MVFQLPTRFFGTVAGPAGTPIEDGAAVTAQLGGATVGEGTVQWEGSVARYWVDVAADKDTPITFLINGGPAPEQAAADPGAFVEHNLSLTAVPASPPASGRTPRAVTSSPPPSRPEEESLAEAPSENRAAPAEIPAPVQKAANKPVATSEQHDTQKMPASE